MAEEQCEKIFIIFKQHYINLDKLNPESNGECCMKPLHSLIPEKGPHYPESVNKLNIHSKYT